MKKYCFILFIFLGMILTVSANSVDNNKDINNLNSKNLLKYLKGQNLNGKNIKVCNQDYCDYLKYDNLEKAVDVYIEDYLDYIKEKIDADTSIIVSLKGFLITEITYF